MKISISLLKKLLKYYQDESYNEAEKLAKFIIEKFPDNQFAWQVLGAVLVKKKKLVEALIPNQKSVQLSPQDAQAHYNLAVTFKELGKLVQAEASYRQAIMLKPDYAEAYNNLGSTLKELDRIEDAKESYIHAIILKPNYAEPNYNLGIVLQELDKPNEAEASYRQAILLKPDYAEAYNNLGSVLLQLGNPQESETCYEKAIKINPNLADAYINLCELMEKLNRLEDGFLVIKKAKDKIIDKISDLFLYEALFLYRQKNAKTSLEYIDKISIDSLSEKRKITYLNLKANLFHDEKDYVNAFQTFRLMNKGIKNSKDYKKYRNSRFFDKIQKKVTQLKNLNLKIIKKKLSQKKSKDPTFLIGFPRSGTTLLDTILRTHSKIDVIEEGPMLEKAQKFIKPNIDILSIEKIDNKTIQNFRNIYFEETKKYLKKTPNLVLIDKLPLNILKVPLIHQMFPQAKFVLALRHPLDCILSCWMQNFKLNKAMATMCELDSIVNLYCLAMEILYQSSKRYSLQIHKVRYEDLLINFEEQVSGILNFLNLKWENNLVNYQETASSRISIDTPSYSQVVKPIYKTAAYRWKNYEKYIDIHKKKLQPWISAFDYLS